MKDLTKRILYNIIGFINCFGMLMLNYYVYKEGIMCIIDDFTFMALPLLIILDIVVIGVFISLLDLIWMGYDKSCPDSKPKHYEGEGEINGP